MKKLLISLLAVAGFAINSQAYTLSFAVPATGSSNALTSPAIIQSFVIVGGSTVTNTLTFIDSYTNSATYTNAFYTNYTFSVGSVTNIYTNWFGVATTNTYQAQLVTTNSVAANTNSFPVRLVATVPPNTTISFSGNYYFYDGLFVTNNAAGAPVVTIGYINANFAPSPNP